MKIKNIVDNVFEESFPRAFNYGFEQIVIPYVDAKISELRSDMNEGFAAVHARIDEAIALNGKYLNDCASKKEHEDLEKRVSTLELAAA